MGDAGNEIVNAINKKEAAILAQAERIKDFKSYDIYQIHEMG